MAKRFPPSRKRAAGSKGVSDSTEASASEGRSPERADGFLRAIWDVFGSLIDNRYRGVVAVFLVVVCLLCGRLFYLQVVVTDAYSSMAEDTRTKRDEILGRRGTIYDRNGVVLAVSVNATDVFANPAKIENVGEAAQRISETLGGDVQDYVELLSIPNSTFVYVKRQVDPDVAERLKEYKIPGIEFEDTMRREYPFGSIGAQVIGFCNVDGNGVSGLENQYDEILQGTDGLYKKELGSRGLPIAGGLDDGVPAVDGTDIMVSIDIKMQAAVEQALIEGIEPLGAEGGSVVLMDAGSGEIFAACSLPYMDPSNMFNLEEGADQIKAITQQFEPGSIFKTVTVLTALENGVMKPEDELFCPAYIEADGYTVSDSHERDDETFTLREILDQSSNVGVSLVSEKIGFDRFYENIIQYNLNEASGVDYPGEAAGYLQDISDWNTIEGYNISFGQGISVTPLQMTRFYAAIINDGYEVTPHFLISKPQTGEVPEYESVRVIDNLDALEDMKSMLRTVVTDGTGTTAGIEGYDVCGKTSTAEVAEGGVYLENIYNLCFTGFIDNSSSSLVCFVGANRVEGMAQVTHVFKDIMTSAIEQYSITPN